MSDLADIDKKLAGIKISPAKKVDTGNEEKRASKPSNIFLKKNFASLSNVKKKTSSSSQSSDTLSLTPKKKAFDKNAFFSDTPLAVDDKKWGHKFFEKENIKPQIIDSPLKNTNDHRADIQFVDGGFKKYASSDSPFKDPYSILNNKSIERQGALFLDTPNLYKNDQTLADNLIKSLDDYNDGKESEKLEEEEIDEKDRTVKGLSVNLLDHQVHGLKFLRRREKSKLLLKGGLLCDDMGLGKTVQMIALIVKNRPKEEVFESLDDIRNSEVKPINFTVPLRKYKATLVISPVGLTTQWAKEIKRFAPHLKCLIFHGANRPTEYEELLDYDVVISSYDTIRSEFGKIKSSPIYAAYWHRVVLDEAHTIKNKKSLSAKATYNIESLRRWCMTGTPLQNSIEELQSLFIFIRVSRISKEVVWEKDISKLLKANKAREALLLLQQELKVLMLRRTKSILQTTNFKLPTKTVHRCEISFSKLEEKLYKDLKDFFVGALTDQYSSLNSHDRSQANENKNFTHISPSKFVKNTGKNQSFYLGALVYLLRLRQLCCHWKLLSDFNEQDATELNKNNVLSSKQIAKKKLDIDEELDDITNFMNALSVQDTKCEICLVEKVSGTEKICEKCSAKIESNKPSESSKVLKLIEILNKDRKRKTIVFSQFRELLVLLGPILKNHGIKFVMYDGTMNLNQKDKALDTLRNDPETTVLLCSLKSGAVGLNLTAASQVVIFDPWWNPQIQEQAIDRVYRIGQTKPVDVYEFAMKDSIEIGIFKLQDKKRELAKAVVNNDVNAKSNLNKLTQSDLIKLFGLKTYKR
ncbi:hypothetical protein WICMUC_001174 [Wickerhamomyces mucosus]|uniref:Uncharacterized protein n=1 Tax=Wickerhamomyces mucosus TaxID=1378264 RepID=A0A9P8PVN5_9ASCO|nr:hypothetical protein WICMUC_001174 [Wickerhamomyces mucosus]